jgi:murein DD-endopeptidase MepM/ murein hydrolase activator NlpD
MKRTAFIMMICMAFVSTALSKGDVGRQSKQNRDMVGQQYRSDKERKEAILRKMREFMNEVNGRLGTQVRTRVSAPLDVNEATDIKKSEEIYTDRKVPPRVFAYINNEVPARDRAGKSGSPVGKFSFGERVEVLMRTTETESSDGATAPWYLVRRDRGEEGWIFGAYLQGEKPVRIEKKDIAPEKKEEAEKEEPVPAKRERFFAYVVADGVKLRAEGTRSAGVRNRLSRGERVEVLVQSKAMDTIDGLTRPWFLVKRDDGSEGWVFGAFLQKKPIEKTQALDSGEGMLAVPAIGRVSSEFGYRVHPVTKKSNSFHSGLDIMAPRGTRVVAAADGVAKIVEFNRHGYGNLIVIEHERELSTYYAHLETMAVRAGQRVARGEQIGTVDTTGLATGPHLHFEVRKGGTALDPNAFLR